MAITAGTNLNSVAAPQKQTLSSNYVDFTSSSTEGWAQQYLPDLMEKEAEVFGPRTISGFLSQVGAEEAMTADQVVWSEQGRLHLSYKGHVVGGAATVNVSGTPAGGAIEIDTTIDDVAVGTSSVDHGIRVNDMVLVADASATAQGLVTAVSNDQISIALYNAGNSTATFANAGLAAGSGDTATILVYGSEFKKGDNYNGTTTDQRGANEPQFKTFQNKPIIMKDYYEVSGSDASRIGWVEVSAEAGQSGYLWYLKAEADTRARFTDYLEMAMLEAEKTAAAGVIGFADKQIRDTSADSGAGGTGTEGLFAAIEDRGNVNFWCYWC